MASTELKSVKEQIDKAIIDLSRVMVNANLGLSSMEKNTPIKPEIFENIRQSTADAVNCLKEAEGLDEHVMQSLEKVKEYFQGLV